MTSWSWSVPFTPRFHRRLLGALGSAIALHTAAASAQQLQPVPPPSATPGVGGRPESAAALLGHTITLDLTNVSVLDAIRIISASVGNRVLYNDVALRSTRRVSFPKRPMTVKQALDLALAGTGLTPDISAGGMSIYLKHAEDAQPQVRLIGRVVDAATDEPIANAKITLGEPTVTITSGPDGRFGFAVPIGTYTLHAIRLGYAPYDRKEIKLTAGSIQTLEVRMTRESTRLKDVITTATGLQTREALGTRVTTINVDSLAPITPIKNLSDVLDGRAPGVTVFRQSGMAGAPSRIQIRGTNSLRLDNGPIVVVDGVRVNGLRPLQGTSVTNSGGTASIEYASNDGAIAPSRFDDIDPETIASIEVLNGPSASTLYGTDAANGVIVITTKRGRSGPARWALHGENSWSHIPGKFPQMYYGFGQATGLDGIETTCSLSQLRTNACSRMDSVGVYNPLNDARVRPFGAGNNLALGAQVSGGSSQLQYFLGGDGESVLGVARASDAEIARIEQAHGGHVPDWQRRPNTLSKFNLTSRLNSSINDKTDVALSSSFIHQTSLGNGGTPPIPTAIAYLDTAGYYPSEQWAASNTSTVNRAYGSLNGTWRPASRWSLRGTTGADYSARLDDAILRAGDCVICRSLRDSSGYGSSNRYNQSVLTLDFGGTYALPLSDAVMSRTSAGVQYTRTNIDQLLTTGQNVLLGTQFPSQAATTSGSSGADATFGSYLEEVIALRDRLFLTAAVRRDAGSAFGRDIQAPLYPKASLSWVVSNEPFFPTSVSRLVSNLRLRTAYGESGNQPLRTDAYPVFSPSATTVDGQVVSGADLVTSGNPNLRPERSGEWEGGLDLGLLHDRVHFEGTIYKKKNRDVLTPLTLAASAGGVTRVENLGSIENHGTELSADVVVLDSKPLGWTLGLRRSANASKLTSINPTALALLPRFGTIAQDQYRVGYPLGGVWAQPILQYSDINHDGLIGPSEVIIGDTAVFLGSQQPGSTMSVNSVVSLLSSRLRISTQFNYTGHFTQINSSEMNLCNANRCAGAIDPQSSLAAQARYVALQPGVVGYSSTQAGFAQTVSMLRFAELSLAYTLPNRVTRAMRAESATLLLMGRNLGLWSSYRGFDPEVNNWPVGESTVDLGAIPQTRDWTIRMNLQF